MRKFEFKKSYEEIEIDGVVYKVDFSDAKVKEYQNKFNSFYQKSQELENLDVKNMSGEEQREVFDKASVLTKDMLESILGRGTYEGLYKSAGESIFNLIDLVSYLADIVQDKSQAIYEAKKNQYKKKPQKANSKPRNNNKTYPKKFYK